VIDLMLSQNDVAADKMSRDQIVAALGLDRPMHTQYLSWIGGITLHGDLGRSLWQNAPVTELLAARLPVTFELGLLALIVGLTIALPIGTYSALRQDTAGDYIGRSFSILLLAVPSFWLGTVVMVFPSIWWGWSPEVHYARFLDDPWQNLKNMALPAIVLGAGLSAVHDAPDAHDDARGAAAGLHPHRVGQGAAERLVVLRHALRNALVPVITLVGLQAPLLIGGAVIIETIFVIPGMGLLLLEAVNQRDYPIITGVFLVVGVAITLINLLIDMSYGVLDPKVRYR
jgi:peptide/nickel transport system permease protein